MQKCDKCDLHDIRGVAVCSGRECPVKFRDKKKITVKRAEVQKTRSVRL